MYSVTNETGRKFNIRVVQYGGSYGREDCLTHKGVEPLVEFYDMSYPEKFDEYRIRGQFVARYCGSTIAEIEDGNGLDLDHGIPAWEVSAQNIREVKAYLAGFIAGLDTLK